LNGKKYVYSIDLEKGDNMQKELLEKMVNDISENLKIIRNSSIYNLIYSESIRKKTNIEKIAILKKIGISDRNEIAEILNTTAETVSVTISKSKKKKDNSEKINEQN